MRPTQDSPRSFGQLVAFGTVASVDLAAGRCTVATGDIVTGPIRWAGGAAGKTRIWSPPSVGEQVLLICPEGEIAAGVALRGVYCTAFPAPAADTSTRIIFEDGTDIGYDPGARALTAIVAGGGSARIEAPGGITLIGDVTVTGKITASGDVVGNGTSLHDHIHDLVKAGTDKSGPPA